MEVVGLFLIVCIILIVDYNKTKNQNKKLRQEIKRLNQKLASLGLEDEVDSSTQNPAKKETTANKIVQNESVEKNSNKNIERIQNEENLQAKKEEIKKDQIIKTEEQIEEEKAKAQMIKEKRAQRAKEQKNTSILVTGAICIVLSAIVFLMSAWNTIPDILKTSVLVLLTGVFFGCSYIAKDKFKLEKASQAFFYIAMAYIPICLISISIFGLLGNYLSIYGEGKYVYYMFSSAFVASIYYITYKFKNNNYILCGSVLSQMFCIVSFGLIFSNHLVIYLSLLLYNILLMLLTKNNIFKTFYNAIPIIISILILSNIPEQLGIVSFILVLLAINFAMLEFKGTNLFYSYMFNISTMIAGIYSIWLLKDIFGNSLCNVYMLVFIMLTFLIENLLLYNSDRRNILKSISVITICATGMIHLSSMSNSDMLSPYIISICQLLFLGMVYIKSENTGKKLTAFLIPVYVLATGIDIIYELKLPYQAYIIFGIAVFAFNEMLKNKNEKIYKNGFAIIHVYIILIYILNLVANFSDISKDVISWGLLAVMYMYNYFTGKNETFKNLSYIVFNIVLFSVFRFFDESTNLVYYVPMITTLMIIVAEKFINDLNTKSSNIYIGISQVISFIALYSHNDVKNTIFAIILAMIIIIENRNKSVYNNIMPLILIMPAIFKNEFTYEISMGLQLISVGILSVISTKENKTSVYTIFSIIYLLTTFINIQNTYVQGVLFTCLFLAQAMFKKNESEKHIYEFLTYLSMLFLYNKFIKDIQLSTYTLFAMLGYIVVTLVTSKRILVKHIKDIDVIDYIAFGIIYLKALANYSGEADGMLFGTLIIAIIILSYIQKYGAVFVISIAALLLNIFALTREFWFSVPWWIYLLAIGTILIGFAIKNEISDKKTEINAITLIKNIKEKVDGKDE